MSRLERWQPLLLVLLPLLWGWIVFDPGYATDPDSYFHAGVSRRIAEEGWLRTLDALPYTTLHDPFPDVHLVQHLLLVPLVAMFGVELGMKLGILLLSSGLSASLYLVLRRRGVRWPAPWVVLGMIAVPISVAYAVYLKGAAAFLIVLVWFVDALWSGRERRVFALAWLSVYTYVGALILVPLALVQLTVLRIRDGRWVWRPLVATLAGLALGMLLHPGWPAHWGHVARELASIVERDGVLVPGDMRGAEWLDLTGPLIVKLAGVAMATWLVLLARQLSRGERVPADGAVAAIAALGLFGGALIAGSKMLYLFALFTLLAAPLLAEAMRPWPRWIAPLAAALAMANAARTVVELRDQMANTPGMVRGPDYRAMARWLDERAAPGEVVIAAWDDFPGLFAFGERPRYVAGVNVEFLRDGDPRRFEAYLLLWKGVVRDPEVLLPDFFDGARLVLVRRLPRTAGEAALGAQLVDSPAFEEVAGPAAPWRVFRRRGP